MQLHYTPLKMNLIMRAHPIPQNVVSFEDRIIGTLTAKQFSIIATGLALVFVIYLSPMPEKIKIPVMGVLALLSFTAGLMKINDMYLDEWLTTFFSAIYAPTQFLWRKESRLDLIIFRERRKDLAKKQRGKTNQETLDQRLLLNKKLYSLEEKDKVEEEFISQLNFDLPMPQGNITQNTPLASSHPMMGSTNIPPKKPEKEEETPPTFHPLISTEETKRPVLELNVTQTREQYAKESPNSIKVNRSINRKQFESQNTVFPIKGEIVFPREEKPSVKKLEVLSIKNSSIPQFTPTIKTQLQTPNQSFKQEVKAAPINTPVNNVQPTTTTPIKPEIGAKPVTPTTQETLPPENFTRPANQKTIEALPEKPNFLKTTQPVEAVKTLDKPLASAPVIATETKPSEELKPHVVATQPVSQPVPQPIPQPTPTVKKITEVPLNVLEQKSQEMQKQKILQSLQTKRSMIGKQTAKLITPQIPNIIAGVVTDKTGRSLQNVIILIKDLSGNPIRALKSNQLGQFSIATPIPSGVYKLECEKEGCQFPSINLELKGEIVPIIEIKEIS